MSQIPDDPTVVEALFQEMKANVQLRATLDIGFRKKALARIIEGIDALIQQFNEAQHKDLGINPFMANFGAYAITKAEIKDLLDNCETWSKPTNVQTPIAVGVAKSSVQPQPLGLALVLSAWNYPIYTALPQVAAAIAAGNSVILKPSQLAPHTSKVLSILFNKFLDPRFYRCIQGKVEVAKKIVQMPFDIICFTGSTATGRAVAIEAAKNLTPCLLQLGGKCPVIVDQTANIESAVKRILFGKFLNCGQTCVGVDHVYVHSDVAVKFKKILLEKTKQFYGRKDLMTCGDYAKIINEGHVERLRSYLAEDHGGKVLLEGVISKQNRYIEPHIIEEPRNSSKMMTQEIFGPILPIKVYDNEKYLIQEINSRQKPLVVYHFTSDSAKVAMFRKNTSSGSYVQNDTVVQLLNPHLPFGGVGGSGSGRYHGYSGFLAFSNPRSICLTKPVDTYPLSTRYPPYTDSNKRVMTFLLKVGGVSYQTLGKWFRISLLVAAGLGYLFYGRMAMRPRV